MKKPIKQKCPKCGYLEHHKSSILLSLCSHCLMQEANNRRGIVPLKNPRPCGCAQCFSWGGYLSMALQSGKIKLQQKRALTKGVVVPRGKKGYRLARLLKEMENA